MTGTATDTMAHEALVHEGGEELAAGVGPFAREGLRRGDRVLVAAASKSLGALRAELGPEAARVDLLDTEGWCPHPYQRLQELRRMAEALPEGQGLRVAAEPVWRGTPAMVRSWARYESVVDLALSEHPIRFLCLYDTRRAPRKVLEFAAGVHGACRGERAPRPDRGRVSDLLASGEPTPPADAVVLSGLPVSSVREALRRFGVAAGFPARRVEDFVLAVWEVVVNSHEHGWRPEPPVVWATGEEMVCSIPERGHGNPDPLAGWMPPSADASSGWGLAIARALTDAMELTPTDRGTTVSLYLVK